MPKQMVKARAEASSPSQAQRLSQGLNAAERLQNVQHQQQLYPYRRIGGVIETVAMRRNNYLLEAARTSSGSPSGRSTPTSMDGFSTTTSGRITPTFRFGGSGFYKLGFQIQIAVPLSRRHSPFPSRPARLWHACQRIRIGSESESEGMRSISDR